MALKIDRQDVEFDLTVSFRLSNLAEFVQHKRPTTYIGTPFGPNLKVVAKVLEDGRNKWLGVFIATPSSQSGDLSLEYTFNIRTLSGLLLRRFTRKQVFPPGSSNGKGHLLPLRRSLGYSEMKSDDAIQLVVRVHTSPKCGRMENPHLPSPTSSYIARSFTQPKDERNIKFLLYRKAPKNGEEPVLGEVYASSEVLHSQCDYFLSREWHPIKKLTSEDEILEKAFLEGMPSCEYGEEGPMPSFTSAYDYESDSDLELPQPEEEERYESEMDDSFPDTRALTEIGDPEGSGSLRATNPDVLEDANAEDDNVDMQSVRSERRKDGWIIPPDHSHETGENSILRPDKFKVIKIPDVAYHTWLAVMYYLYTGVIEFAPLTSNKLASYNTMNKDYLEEFPDRPDLVSCKSVLRVADKLGLRELEDRAAAHLESQLNARNIVHEIFTSYTSRYDRVKKIESEFLFTKVPNWRNLPELHQKCEEVVAGKLAHSTWIMLKMIETR